MGVIERASSVSCSSSPRRKERQNMSSQKDNHGLLREKLIRKASSFSSMSPRKEDDKGKKKQSLSCLRESPEVKKTKVIEKVSSFSSSSEKKKLSVSCQESHEVKKVKLIRRASSLSSSSSSPSSMKKEKPVSKVKGDNETRKSSSFKSRVRELGPICKRRKDVLAETPVKVQVEDDIDLCLDKQIQEEGKDNPDDCLWLSSGSMTPQEFGLFMSSLDPSVDEWIISFLPNSSLKKPDSSNWSNLVPEEVGSVIEEEKVNKEGTEPSSSFWNMDRTGVWVSLINLDGEDSKWISEMDSSEELESNFPSPNYEINWDSYSSDVGFSSSARSTQETSHSEWSSDLLSDSMDWEFDSDDPIFWPFGKDFDWDDQGWEPFSVSPRRGLCKINFEPIKDGSIPPRSIKLRLRAKKPDSKETVKRRILFVSGLSASKMIEFKKGRKSRNSKTMKRAARFKKRVPPILENILEEGKSPKETPKKAKDPSSDILSETTYHLDDEMDTDGPLFWPTGQKCAWDSTWSSFNISPRKSTRQAGSPKAGFSVSSSIKLRIRPMKKEPKTSDLSTSKSFKFKSRLHKYKVISSNRKSTKGVYLIMPSRMPFRLNKSSEFKPGSSRKRTRAMPSKTSMEEFMRLVSVMGKNRKFSGDEITSEELPIEIVMGLDEFDGHEGVDSEFKGDDFKLEECMEE